MRNAFLLLLILSVFSCSRGYYNITQTYYNYEEAYNLVHGLNEGTLIVQIPCEKKKNQILTSIFEKETNAKKKKKYKNDLDSFKSDLLAKQKALIAGTEKFYIFSSYAFVPDTLIQEFKNGERENIFFNTDFSFRQNVSIDTTKTIMFLRSLRDYDDLFIHKFDGSYPPDPFPFASTLPTGEMDRLGVSTIPNTYDAKDILNAILIINNRLVGFYEYRKPPE